MISVLDHNQLEGITQLTNLNLNQFDLRGKGKKINVFDWAWYGWRENKSNCFNLIKKFFFDEIEFVQAAGPDSQIEEQIEFHGIELDWI